MNDTYRTIEKFLKAVFYEDMIGCAAISVACAEKNNELLTDALNNIISFAQKLKDELKECEQD